MLETVVVPKLSSPLHTQWAEILAGTFTESKLTFAEGFGNDTNHSTASLVALQYRLKALCSNEKKQQKSHFSNFEKEYLDNVLF